MAALPTGTCVITLRGGTGSCTLGQRQLAAGTYAVVRPLPGHPVVRALHVSLLEANGPALAPGGALASTVARRYGR